MIKAVITLITTLDTVYQRPWHLIGAGPNAWGKPLCSHRPPAGELFGSAALVCVTGVRLALQTRSVTISPSSRLVNITAPTDLHRPSDPQVNTDRPSSFSFACKAVGPCTDWHECGPPVKRWSAHSTFNTMVPGPPCRFCRKSCKTSNMVFPAS